MPNKVTDLFLVVAGLLLLALLSRNGDIAWMAVPFLVYMGMAILRSPSIENIRLHATRSLEISKTPERSTIEVRVTICNQGPAIHQINFFDPLQPGMHITDGQIQHPCALNTGETALLQYTFQAERGKFCWDSVQAKIGDPFGLMETRLNLPAAADTQVHPGIQKFQPFPIRLKRTLHSSGSIPARLGGSGTDFWGVREYHTGDSLRRLDWRLTARHPHKFFSKEFEQEEIAEIGLILDARKKTDMLVGGDSLFEHSVRAAASLAELFLTQGNRVSMLIHGDPIIRIYPGYGKIQLNRISQALAATNTESEATLGSLSYLSTRMFSSQSLILVLSPLAPNDWLLFPTLRADGYQVLLISPDPFDFAKGLFQNDTATNLARRLARVERHLEIWKIMQLWIPVIDWQVSKPLAPLVREALHKNHIQRQR
jgi:uncharacterized protein (DUF58 family)